MALSTTPLAGNFWRAHTAVAPLVEAALVAAVIALLLPLFARVAALDAGRDGRFADAFVAAPVLPDEILPRLCALHGALAEDVVRDRLCAHTRRPFVAPLGSEPLERMPALVANTYSKAREAFAAPLRDAGTRLARLRASQREGVGDLLALGNAIASTEADIAPYVERYRLDSSADAGPIPLACAYGFVAAALAAQRSPGDDVARANAMLLLGGALDGHAAVASLADNARLPVQRGTPRADCDRYSLGDALGAAATLVADARAAPVALAKNDAMRQLLRTAGWQWAAWSLAGLALLNLSRRPRLCAVGLALALATWAVAAWAGRVPWPLGGAHGWSAGRAAADWTSPPAPFVVAMLAGALLVLALSPWLRNVMACTRQASVSPLAYPGAVALTGIGWLLLLDLSANGHFGNRYLALYHQGHLWLAMIVFSLVAFARQPLVRALAWTLAVIDGAASALRIRLGALASLVAFALVTLALIAIVGALLLNIRQITSEMGRLWLVVGAAWFFFMRGTPLTERLARAPGSLDSLARYVAPLVFVVAVLIGAMIVTHDMGPLLIDAYGAGALVAASVAMWLYQRGGARAAAYALAAALFVAWIVVVTVTLFRLGAIDDVTAARLENVAAPLASANDQLALVTWFQRAAPPQGFGLGAIPWCGYGASGGCAGVPAQIQSDYTFTALVGAFGWTGAWAITLCCAIWPHAIVRRHGRATRGEPRLVRAGDRLANDEQALASWLVLAWIVLALCQLAVTVAGNLAVIPLTGVTFPFVSFGMTSLVTCMAMLALAANVDARAAYDD